MDWKSKFSTEKEKNEWLIKDFYCGNTVKNKKCGGKLKLTKNIEIAKCEKCGQTYDVVQLTKSKRGG